MMSISTELWVNIILFFATCAIAIYGYFKYKFTYWKRRGFPNISGKFPCGALTDFILSKQSISEALADIYKQGKGHKYVGYYSFCSPTLLVRDLEMIKTVLVKEFEYHFIEKGMYYNEKEDPLSAHIFALEYSKWKPLRVKLSPTFTSAKMKFMYGTVKLCVSQLKDYMTELMDNNENVIDFKEVIARHGVNIIANTAVGIEGHKLNEDSELSRVAFQVTEPNIVQAFRFILPMISKDVARLFRLRFTPKNVSDYYLQLMKQIVEYRNENNIKRNDFIHLLMEIWDKSTDYDEPSKPDDEHLISLKDMAAQTFIFILAGYESSSSVVCFTLYELAKNPEIQEKLMKEIDRYNDDISYEELGGLKYMDMVFHETLRKYPAGGFLFRECSKDYTFPNGEVLEKGINVTVSVHGLHHDPELFPEPDKFDPERFNKENPSHPIQSFSYLPFGEGPRFCIGKRFGVMQIKLTLFALIKYFRFEITKETIDPPKLDPKIFVTHSEDGMTLKMFKRR